MYDFDRRDFRPNLNIVGRTILPVGLDTKHQTYARAASSSMVESEAEAPPEEVSTLEDGVVRFLTTKGFQSTRATFRSVIRWARRRQP